MNLSKISVVVTTFNEETNIGRCLDCVRGFGEVLVIDSFSSDRTLEIARKYPVTIFSRPYRSAATQKNWALERTRHRWVLILDADEALTDDLKKEIMDVDETAAADGYWIKRRSEYLGGPIRYCGWQRDKVLRLFKKDKGDYEEREVHEEVELKGHAAVFDNHLVHFPFKGIHHHFEKMEEYTTRGARDVVRKGGRYVVLKMLLHPPFRFLRMYVLQKGILDGRRGFVLCVLASYGVFLKYAKAWERRFAREES